MSSNPNEVLFLSEKFSDVTFIVETQSIPAHKLLLAASCPYFENMLFGATNESKMSVIEIKNVSHKEFMEVIRSVYVRKVVISGWTPEEVKKLVQIADEYQFQEMGRFLSEAVDIDTQVTIDVLEDLVGVASRLNSSQLMETCVEAVKKRAEFLFSNEDAFDKLPMALIIHLIDNKVWNAADARLVYSIGNWRKNASIEDKKVLLSKIDWKSLPGRYSEPIVRMFLENDEKRVESSDWTKELKGLTVDGDMIAGIYRSYDGWVEESAYHSFLTSTGHLPYRENSEHIVFVFRERVFNIRIFSFVFKGCATFSLNLFGSKGETSVNGVKSGSKWEFVLPSNFDFSRISLKFTMLVGGGPRGIRDFEFTC